MKLTYLLPVTASSPETCGMVPSEAVQILQEVMEYGRSMGKDGWWKQPRKLHLLHAHHHLLYATYNPDSGTPPLDPPNPDADEPHLDHAFCRIMMALLIERGYVPKPYGGFTVSELADMRIEPGIDTASVTGFNGEKLDVSYKGDDHDHLADVLDRETVPDQSGTDRDEEGERTGVAGCRRQ